MSEGSGEGIKDEEERVGGGEGERGGGREGLKQCDKEIIKESL